MKLWTPNFIKMFVANFMNANSFYILVGIIPLFVQNELHLDKSKVGLVMGSFSITAVLIRPFIGIILDSFGRKLVYFASMFFIALCNTGYMFVATLGSIIVLRLIHGSAWGMTSTSGSTIVTDMIVKERRAEGLGYYVLAMNVGMALGPGAGLFLLDLVSFEKVFMLCALFSFSAFAVAISIKYRDMERTKAKFNFKTMFEKRVAGLSMIQALYGFSYASVMSFAIIFANNMNIKGSALFFALYAVTMSVMRPISGRYLDRNGPGHLMGLGFIILMAGYALLGVSRTTPVFLTSSALLGIGGGIVSPLIVAMAMNVVPVNKRGIANATIFSAFDLGIGTGSVCLGIFAELFSITKMFLFSSVLLILPLIYYYISVKAKYENIIKSSPDLN